jgi:hypothetical protein
VSEANNSDTRAVTEDPALDFYSGAYSRMNWCMLIVGVAAVPAAFWAFNWRFGIGYLLGAAVAFLNLYWLRRLVTRMGDVVLRKPEATTRAGRMVAVFLLRYALVGLGAYVIFKSSVSALYGLFAGLILPVAGVFCEAAFEIAYALRRPGRSPDTNN